MRQDIAKHLANPSQRLPKINIEQIGVDGVPKLNVVVLSDQEVTLDHTKAAQYIDLPIFAGERDVSDGHVQFLYDEMRKARFNEKLVILSTAQLDGVTYKINGQHTCFPAGTAIRMADGSNRAIDKILAGEMVLSAEGNIRRVEQTQVRDYSGSLARISICGHSYLRCTPDHPILTRRGYVAASELEASDWVAFPKYALSPRSENDDHRLWRRVRHVNVEPFAGQVYNLGVDGDHSYVAEGVGVHNCWACLFMPPSYSLKVREIRYKVKDKEQLKLLYSTYDRLRDRSDAHISKVLLADDPVMEDIHASSLNLLLGGLKFWLFESKREQQRAAPDQMAVIVHQHVELFRAVGLFIQEHSDFKEARKQPVIAAMFATFDKVPTKAAEFWGPVLTGVGLEAKNDARWRLRDFLISLRTRATSSGRCHREVVSSEDTFRICTGAWNKWRRGDKVEVAIRATKERLKLV